MGAAFSGQQQPMMYNNTTQLGPNQTYYSPNGPQVCLLLIDSEKSFIERQILKTEMLEIINVTVPTTDDG